jgi:diguanylate cyclase (GGDEF)-like protein/PAS domain S-box-containing protein
MSNDMPKILIADDNEAGRQLLSRILSSAGYEIILAENGEQALEVYREQNPDLIITDLNMPVMDGFELVGAIRQDANSAHVPIIFISAMYKDIVSKVKAMDIGGNEYLTLPIDRDELLFKVKAILRNKNLYDELLRSREALKESERKYRTLFNNATDAIYLIHTKTQKILDCNPKASEVTGYTSKELKTMTISDLHPDSEQDIVSKIFKKMNKTGKFSDIMGINHLSKDGRLIPIEINATTFKMVDKTYSLGIFRDITERRKAEERLLYEKNKILSVLDAMQDGVYIVNQKYDIEYINPVLKKAFGAVVGHKCYEYFHSRKKVCPMCKNNEVFAGNVIRWEWFSTVNHKSYDIIDTPLKNPDGSISKLALCRDITDRKKIENSLARSRAEFQAVINSIPDAVIFVDTERNIILTNPAVQTIFGYDFNYLRGKTTEILYSDKAQYEEQGEQRFHPRAVTNSRPYEIMYKRKDNSVFIGETLGTPVKDSKGSTIGFAGIIRDITLRKKMEEKLREAAVTDDLTGLFNRRGFITISDKHLNLAKRQKKRLSLLYLDLDNLKLINDELGHKEGDLALKDTANLLKKSFRESDIVARIGGDEFAVLLTEMTNDADMAIAHLRENIERINDRTDRAYPLSLSSGFAYYDPVTPVSIDKLISQADLAMYEEKKSRKIANHVISKKAAKTEEKRSDERFLARDECSVRFNGSGNIGIKDISSGGICLTSPRRLAPNSIYEIKLVSPARKEITSSGMVIWSSRHKSKPSKNKIAHHYETGFKFIGLNEAARNALDEFITEVSR